ncbi:MAG: hypothetical protein ACRER2_09080 [Methylococcales bacterium]
MKEEYDFSNAEQGKFYVPADHARSEYDQFGMEKLIFLSCVCVALFPPPQFTNTRNLFLQGQTFSGENGC